METVTMYNPTTKVYVYNVPLSYVERWNFLGFEIHDFDSDKVVLLKRAS